MNDSKTRYLERPGGTLAYTVTGTGPLVVCSPGLGDLRSTFTDLTGILTAHGVRVAAIDLRGHGESSTGWASYSVTDVAEDMLAVARELDDAPAVLLGNSYSGGAAVVAAADSPAAVAGVVLSGAFVRDLPRGPMESAMMRLVSLPLLGRALWMSYWPRLFGPVKPANFERRRQELAANMADPARFAATREMLRHSHTDTERALSGVTCPVLVVMGDEDPDFPEPANEAETIAERVNGPADVLMVHGAGHYPHAERPEKVAPAIVELLRRTKETYGVRDGD